MLILGILCFFPIASGCGFAWFTFHRVLENIAFERTADDLVAHPPDYNGVVRVRLTPEPSLAHVVKLGGYPDATLVPVAESPQLALLVFTSPKFSASTIFEAGEPLPRGGTQTLVVHRDDHSLVESNAPRVVLASDERGVGVLRNIALARSMTIGSCSLGLVLALLGLLLGRRRTVA